MAIAENLTKRYVNQNARSIKLDHWNKRKDGFLFLWFDSSGNVLKKIWVDRPLAYQIFSSNIAKEAFEYVDTPRKNWWGGLKDSMVVVGYCEDDNMYSMQDYPLEVA
jgi:hypothetical protein